MLPFLIIIPLLVVAPFVMLAVRTRIRTSVTEADPLVRVESLTDDTVIADDGSVRSVQSADVWLPSDRYPAVWTASNLERLARTYWFHLGQMSGHLLRVMYTPNGRAMALLGLVPLITFEEPEYELDERHGSVTWIIRNGVLVSKRKKSESGYLGIQVDRLESDRPGYDRIHVEMTVANFYPALSGLSQKFYSETQSRLHVFAANGFLRSLAHGELVPSKVGRFSQWPKELGVRRDERREAKEAAKK